MNLKYIIIIAFSLFLGNALKAQNPREDTLAFFNPEIAEIADQAFDRSWLVYKQELEIAPKDLFETYGELFGLGMEDKMEFLTSERDEIGYEQFKFQQYHKDILVEDAIYILIAQANQLLRSNGTVIANLAAPERVGLSEREALKTALAYVNADKYAWEDEELEQELKEDTGDENATHFPKAELLYSLTQDDLPYLANNYRLTYRFTIYSITPDQYLDVYVDASNNRVLKTRTKRIECDHGTVNTLYNGTHTINANTAWEPFWNHYRLIDNCSGHDITTKKYFGGGHFKDGDNVWSGDAATAHWAVGVSWDYFKNKFGRNGVDNAAKPLTVKPDYGGLNAYWQNGNLVFGKNGSASIATLDIAGHEYTHGVVEYTSGLIYANESGALNESFADIFGSAIQHEVEGMSADIWELGEDAFHIRSLANPNAFGDPDSYHETGQWYFGTGDYGGVHTNSGVQNHWFYLLANGGSNNGISVSGIGISKAASIAYRNLAVYLNNNSNYIDARNGAIFSALDLYGECSFELEQTIKAWNAVNVDSGIGIGHNYVVNCGSLNFIHGFNLPFKRKAINQIDIACVIAANTYTELKAGNSIYLNPGFYSTGNFEGIIFDCEGDLPASLIKEEDSIGGNHITTPNSAVLESRTVENQSQVRTFPNPFRTSAIIEYQLDQAAPVTASLHDTHGRQIRMLLPLTQQESGMYQIVIERQDLAAGMYYYRLNIKDEVFTEKVVIVD